MGGHRAPGSVEPVLAVGHRPLGSTLVEESREPLREDPIDGLGRVVGVGGVTGRFGRGHFLEKHFGLPVDPVGREFRPERLRLDATRLPGAAEDRRVGVAPAAEQLLGFRDGPVERFVLEPREGVGRDERVQRPDRTDAVGRAVDVLLDATVVVWFLTRHCTPPWR